MIPARVGNAMPLEFPWPAQAEIDLDTGVVHEASFMMKEGASASASHTCHLALAPHVLLPAKCCHCIAPRRPQPAWWHTCT